MKVYIVAQHDYSDYSVEGVFLSEDEANAFIELHKDVKRSYLHMEEWDTSAPMPKAYYAVQLASPKSVTYRKPEFRLAPELNTVSSEPPATYVREAIGPKGTYVGYAFGETYELAEKNLWEAIEKAKASSE